MTETEAEMNEMISTMKLSQQEITEVDADSEAPKYGGRVVKLL